MKDVIVERLNIVFALRFGDQDYRSPTPDPLRHRAANLRAQAALEGLKEHLSEQSQRWQIVQELERVHREYGDAWQEAQSSYRGNIEEAIAEIRSRPNARPRPGSEALLGAIGYLEDVERLFGEVEGILNPPQLRRILLATRCRHCPVP